MKITVGELKGLIREVVNNPKKRYQQWLKRVEVMTKRKLGLNVSDIPNVDLSAAFSAGMTPLQTFEDVLFPAQGGYRGLTYAYTPQVS